MLKSTRRIGTVSRGIRLPVIAEGDDIVSIVTESLIEASASQYEPFEIKDRDIVGVTESLLARAQGNYISTADIAADIKRRVPSGDVAILFPIMSRNRFYPLLRGIAEGVTGKIHVCFSYPNDEVGNQLIAPMDFYRKVSALPSQSFDEDFYYSFFGAYKHPFTGVDYVELYKSVAPDRVVCHFTNDPLHAMKFADSVIVASIHMRALHKEILQKAGANVIGLVDICSEPLHAGMGYNAEYGLLGSNYTSDEKIKLFPRDSDKFAHALQARINERTGKSLEVLVYGDGAFKDPVCGIWELADPVVSPGFTEGLTGTPKEIKLKYIADSASGDSTEAVMDAIRSKGAGEVSEKASLGTTPRQLTDLVGSLCDLTSGSGDKGTPVVHISGYFSSYADE